MSWQNRISRPDAPAVPIFIKRMRRTFWCPPGYERVIRYVASHPTFTQRELAEATDTSLGGVERALRRLRQWGALVLEATKGRLGRTHARVQTDVRTANVSPTGERIFLRPSLRVVEPLVVSVADTLPLGTGYETWRSLFMNRSATSTQPLS